MRDFPAVVTKPTRWPGPPDSETDPQINVTSGTGYYNWKAVVNGPGERKVTMDSIAKESWEVDVHDPTNLFVRMRRYADGTFYMDIAGGGTTLFVSSDIGGTTTHVCVGPGARYVKLRTHADGTCAVWARDVGEGESMDTIRNEIFARCGKAKLVVDATRAEVCEYAKSRLFPGAR